MNWIRFDKEGSFRKRLLCAETGAQLILDPEKRRLVYLDPGPALEKSVEITLRTREEAERRFGQIETQLTRRNYT